jgi:hypothetical protein
MCALFGWQYSRLLEGDVPDLLFERVLLLFERVLHQAVTYCPLPSNFVECFGADFCILCERHRPLLLQQVDVVQILFFFFWSSLGVVQLAVELC